MVMVNRYTISHNRQIAITHYDFKLKSRRVEGRGLDDLPMHLGTMYLYFPYSNFDFEIYNKMSSAIAKQ